MDRNRRNLNERPIRGPSPDSNSDLEPLYDVRAHKPQNLANIPQLNGYSDSDIDVDSDQGFKQEIVQRKGSTATQSRISKPKAHFRRNSTDPLRQNNTGSVREMMKQTSHNRRSQALTSGHDAQASPNADSRRNNLSGLRAPVVGHLVKAKRPLTPSAPASATPPKRAKCGPFEDDSSGEDGDTPEKPKALSQQLPTRSLNLARLKEMVRDRNLAASGKSTMIGPPTPNAQASNAVTQQEQKAKAHVSIKALVPLKRKAENAGCELESVETVAKKAAAGVNGAAVTHTQRVTKPPQPFGVNEGTRSTPTSMPSTVPSSTTRLVAANVESSTATPSPVHRQAKSLPNTLLSARYTSSNSLPPKSFTVKRPGASAANTTPTIATSASPAKPTPAKRPAALLVNPKSTVAPGASSIKISPAPVPAPRPAQPAVTLGSLASSTPSTTEVASTNNTSAEGIASHPKQFTTLATAGTQARAASSTANGRTTPASPAPKSGNKVPVVSTATPPRPGHGNLLGRTNGISTMAHNAVITKQTPTTTATKVGNDNTGDIQANSRPGAQSFGARTVGTCTSNKTATGGVNLQHSRPNAPGSGTAPTKTSPNDGRTPRMNAVNTAAGRNSQNYAPIACKQAPIKPASTNIAQNASTIRPHKSTASTATGDTSASRAVPNATGTTNPAIRKGAPLKPSRVPNDSATSQATNRSVQTAAELKPAVSAKMLPTNDTPAQDSHHAVTGDSVTFEAVKMNGIGQLPSSAYTSPNGRVLESNSLPRDTSKPGQNVTAANQTVPRTLQTNIFTSGTASTAKYDDTVPRRSTVATVSNTSNVHVRPSSVANTTPILGASRLDTNVLTSEPSAQTKGHNLEHTLPVQRQAGRSDTTLTRTKNSKETPRQIPSSSSPSATKPDPNNETLSPPINHPAQAVNLAQEAFGANANASPRPTITPGSAPKIKSGISMSPDNQQLVARLPNPTSTELHSGATSSSGPATTALTQNTVARRAIKTTSATGQVTPYQSSIPPLHTSGIISNVSATESSTQVSTAEAVQMASTAISLTTPEQSTTPNLTNPINEIPVMRLKDVPLDPAAIPYFEYTVHEKMWSASDNENSAQAIDISGHITCLDEANNRAEQRFAYVRKEDAKHKHIRFSEWSNKRDHNDCISCSGTFSPIDFASQKSHHKIWVQRHIVCAIAATVQPPAKSTNFISKAVYILRLFKLVDDPSHTEPPASEDDEDAAAQTSSSSESDSDSDSASESDSDPDKGKHNKKARAKLRSSLTPTRKSRSAPAPYALIRQYHPIANWSEIYTTLEYANRAARRLQIELSHEESPSNPLTVKWQEQNRRELEEQVLALEAEHQDEEEGNGLWRSEFNGCGCGGDRFELLVERTVLGGPRNV